MEMLLYIAVGAFLFPFCFGLGCICVYKMMEKLVKLNMA